MKNNSRYKKSRPKTKSRPKIKRPKTKRPKIKRPKTVKIYKGGNPTDDLVKRLNGLIDLYTSNPFLILKKAFESGLYSLSILNDLLILSCLYIKNIFYLKYDTNLNNILPEKLCFDLFEQDTCNTKINKLLNMKSYKEHIDKIPNEFKPIQKGGQRGGSNSCKNVNNSIICDDGRQSINDYKPPTSNVYLELVGPLTETKIMHPDKETAIILLFLEFNDYNLFQLYRILQILKILYKIQIPVDTKNKNMIELTDKDIIRIENNFKLFNDYKGSDFFESIGYSVDKWKQCSDFHLERKNLSESEKIYLSQMCNVKCPDCTMTSQSKLYKPDITNYNKPIGRSLVILDRVLNDHYEFISDKSIHHKTTLNDFRNEAVRELLNNKTDEEIFIFFNIGEPKNKKLIDVELIQTISKISLQYSDLKLHRFIAKLLLHKLCHQDYKYEEFMKKSLNMDSGTSSIDYIKK